MSMLSLNCNGVSHIEKELICKMHSLTHIMLYHNPVYNSNLNRSGKHRLGIRQARERLHIASIGVFD